MSASKKSGGNKKTASPSDVSYQSRRKMGNRSDVNKAKRIARHKLRMQRKAAHRAEYDARRAEREARAKGRSSWAAAGMGNIVRELAKVGGVAA